MASRPEPARPGRNAACKGVAGPAGTQRPSRASTPGRNAARGSAANHRPYLPGMGTAYLTKQGCLPRRTTGEALDASTREEAPAQLRCAESTERVEPPAALSAGPALSAARPPRFGMERPR